MGILTGMDPDPLDAEDSSIDDTAADERERHADERERIADERERVADEREEGLAAWEARLDLEADAQGRSHPSSRQRSYEAIERARGRVASSLDRLDRSEAALRRADARDVREQRIADSEASGPRALRDGGRIPRDVLEARARRLHRRYAVVAFALGATQSALADEYERLAVEEPELAAEYRRRAEQAHRTAALLRSAEVLADQDSDTNVS